MSAPNSFLGGNQLVKIPLEIHFLSLNISNFEKISSIDTVTQNWAVIKRRELLYRRNQSFDKRRYLRLLKVSQKFPAALELHPSGGVHPSFFFLRLRYANTLL